MDHHQQLRFAGGPSDVRQLQNQPTISADSLSDETMAETDEPPDEPQFATTNARPKQTPGFKKLPCPIIRKQSLLTQTLHTSESDSQDEETEAIFSGSNRAHSSASTWSRGSVASTAELTDEHLSPTRTGTPSPPLPSAHFDGVPPDFSSKLFEAPAGVKIVSETIDPHRKVTPISGNEDAVEKGLGRKRCIMFACKSTSDSKAEDPPKPKEQDKKADTPGAIRRPSALKFVCPTKVHGTPTANKTTIRLASPPPPTKRIPNSPKAARAHRGSDSTVRNDSPTSVRKVPSVLRNRKPSNAAEVAISEATRFHEFASSEEENDDWTQEKTCHRARLTVQDTLKVENRLRRLGEEAEDEELEEEEAEEELAGIDDEEDIDDDDDDDDNQSLIDSTGYVTDEGFHTDDEDGFANSDDDDSDTGSDYRWWAPGTGSGEQLEHIRPTRSRTSSGSSIGSFSSTRVFPSKTPKAMKRSKTNPIEMRPRTPELPDSTDFVCGTLDEDRPLEEAWLSCRAQRRLAKHKPCPQDIDPTFPASDPEMEEEDEEDYQDVTHVDDSDHHFLIHGHPEFMSDIDAREPRAVVMKKRSPAHSPKRMRSPPPVKRAVHHSPPPRRLFGHSPKRMRSPAPKQDVWSPPPSRRTSFIDDVDETPRTIYPHPHVLAERPAFGRATSSLPRNGPMVLERRNYFNPSEDDTGEETQTDVFPSRGAIDIVKGLEKKRQRRKEKLFEKHCRLKNQGKNVKQHVVLPGKGAARMKHIGEGLSALRGRKNHDLAGVFEGAKGEHILSY